MIKVLANSVSGEIPAFWFIDTAIFSPCPFMGEWARSLSGVFSHIHADSTIVT